MPKKVIAFDLDGTLAPSKAPLPPEVATVLDRLLDNYEVCVMSGGRFEQFQTQLLGGLNIDTQKLKRLHLMPTCGTQYFRFENGDWKQIYAEYLTEEEKRRITEVINQAIDELGMRETETYGEILEDRLSQITFSALGQDIVAELGEAGLEKKHAWDPDGSKKQRIRDYAARLLPNLEVRTGGATSIDITKPGVDKAYGIKKLMETLGVTKEEILFYGDRLQEGGNDYPVKAMGVESIEVNNWQHTVEVIEQLLADKGE